MSDQKASPEKTQSTPEKLRQDFAGQLNNTNLQLQQLEGEKQRLISYREQLKGAIYALDQVLAATAEVAKPEAAATEAKAEEKAAEAAPAAEAAAENAGQQVS